MVRGVAWAGFLMAGCIATPAVAQTPASNAVTTPTSGPSATVDSDKSTRLFAIDLSLGRKRPHKRHAAFAGSIFRDRRRRIWSCKT